MYARPKQSLKRMIRRARRVGTHPHNRAGRRANRYSPHRTARSRRFAAKYGHYPWAVGDSDLTQAFASSRNKVDRPTVVGRDKADRPNVLRRAFDRVHRVVNRGRN